MVKVSMKDVERSVSVGVPRLWEKGEEGGGREVYKEVRWHCLV